MQNLLCFFIALFLCLSLVQGQETLPPKEAYPLDVKQIHSGHSLTDPLFHPHWPGQYVTLIGMELGSWAGDLIGKSTIPGSPLSWRWNNPPGGGSPDARHDIGDWELLSITERVPLLYEGGSDQGWYIEGIQQQREDLSLFVNNAWINGNDGTGTPTLLWTTWTNIDDSDGPWREMLDILGEEWENMQDYANDNRPDGAVPVYIIPGHKMMARLYDDIQLNMVPGINHISDFFGDNIHTNELGAYAVAMIHYACIYNTSPVGLPNNLIPNAPSGTPIPSPELALYLQQMIWEEVTSYPRTGIYTFLNTQVYNFSAEKNKNQTLIQFAIDLAATAETITIQHSTNGRSFIDLQVMGGAEVTAAIQLFVHDNPSMGKNYYRLKIKDFDGNIVFSAIQMVQFESNKWTIFPNPTSAEVHIKGEPRQYMITIRDIQGRIMISTYQSPITTESLLPGVYFMDIQSGQHVETQKLIKTH